MPHASHWSSGRKGNPEVRRRGEIVEPWRRRRQVPVDEADDASAVEDDIRPEEIVVAHDLSGRRRADHALPCCMVLMPESCLCVVHRAEEGAQVGQDLVRGRYRRERRVTIDEREDSRGRRRRSRARAARPRSPQPRSAAAARGRPACAARWAAVRCRRRGRRRSRRRCTSPPTSGTSRHDMSILSPGSCSRRRCFSAFSIVRIVWPIVAPS